MEIDWDKYDAVILGTPVWCGSVAPAMRKFLMSYKWRGRVVYPFITHGGKVGHALGDYKKGLHGASIGPLLSVKFEENEQLSPEIVIKDWVSSLKNGGRD